MTENLTVEAGAVISELQGIIGGMAGELATTRAAHLATLEENRTLRDELEALRNRSLHDPLDHG